MGQVPPLINDSNLPGVTQKFDRRRTGTGNNAPRFLLLGPSDDGSLLPLHTPTLAPSVADAEALAGLGTPLPEMVEAVLAQYPKAECWIASPSNTGTASAATLTFASTLTDDGVWYLKIGNREYAVECLSGDTVTEQADALEAAIEADAHALVTIDNSAGVCTLTAKFGTAVGDGIAIVLNWGGPSAGHVTPAGGSITELASTPYTTLGGGGAIPSLDTLIGAMADDEYDVIVSAYHDSTSTGDLTAENERRWEPQVDAPLGVWFTAKRGAAADLHAWGDGIDDWRALGASVEPANPASPWVHAAAWAGACGSKLFIQQSGTNRPLSPHKGMMKTRLVGIPATLPQYRYAKAARSLLKDHGVATTYADKAGRVYIENEISTEAGAFIQEAACAMAWARYRRDGLWAKFAQAAIVDDEVDSLPADCIAPRSVRDEILSLALDAVGFGWLRNFSTFRDGLVVEATEGSPNRIDVLETPKWSGQARQIGIVVQPQA